MNISDEIIKELPTALYRWYPFAEESTLLYIGKEDAVFLAFLRMGIKAVCFDGNLNERRRFNYIVISAEVLETNKNPQDIYELCNELLEENGILLFAVHNRFGIRYFCGDRNPYTGGIFDGVDDGSRRYGWSEDPFAGRTYDADELNTMLVAGGFSLANRYSVMPGLENPQMIYADGFIPKEKLISRLFPQYYHPQTVFLEEEKLYDPFLANDMFHQMANAYLFECVKSSNKEPNVSDALQITSSLDRGCQNAMITVVRRNGTVIKKAAFPEGRKRVHELAANMEKLRARRIRTIDGHMDGDAYVMPYVEAETGEVYLKRLLQSDRELFLQKMDEFRSIILRSSDSYEGIFIPPIPEDENEDERRNRENNAAEEWKNKPVCLLKDAFIDMVPLNSFYIDDEFVFFDQEICEHDFPADYIIHRSLVVAHGNLRPAQQLVSRKEMFERYGLPDGETEGKRRYYNLDRQMLRNLRKERILKDYYNMVRRDSDTVTANRQRMNFPAKDHKELFENVFYGLGNKKLVIFGSGRYAKIFFTRFGKNYPIIAAVDNSEDKWDTYMYAEGYEPGSGAYGNDTDDEMTRTMENGHCLMVKSPEYLKKLKYGEYRVVVCIKNYWPVLNQLDEMEIYNYVVYNPLKQYYRDIRKIEPNDKIRAEKKYHIGYTAGAFDMFHIGHVNLLRRSKEMCDHLIVGVMSDEAIRNFKGKEPVIPYDERAAVVASCRYVDEVVEIPYLRGNSDEAWKMYHFEVQFCGSDYIGNEWRMREKAFLESHGAELVMFPYTESTSSTKIRDKLNTTTEDKGYDR